MEGSGSVPTDLDPEREAQKLTDPMDPENWKLKNNYQYCTNTAAYYFGQNIY
jgi:hypothetical protein